MKTEIVLKACGSTVVQLQSHAFQEVSSQEICLFKPSAIHEPHFWNEPTKPSQLHSFNKTPTAVCPGSNRLYSSSDFVHDVTKERKFQMITHQESSSFSLSKEFGYILLNFVLVFSVINHSPRLVVCFCDSSWVFVTWPERFVPLCFLKTLAGSIIPGFNVTY